MNIFWGNVGVLAFAFLIVYIYKRILEWNDWHSGFYEDEKVYQVADEFVHGASSDDIEVALSNCLGFDKGDVEKILSLSTRYRTDKDGGYRGFLRSVNKVLGENIYDEKHHVHETKR